ncbi:MAG: aminoglycoside phosphotransferase [Caulobacterales bacterium 32-67-6]|nr:MAG: aminoglycoside phosphotransferase [Caulobacterales bacterium 32-67-6]
MRLSSDREGLKADFLARHGLADAERIPLAGDASTRRYERLSRPGKASLIFMDQPPVETAPCPPDASPEQRRLAGYNAMARLAAGRVDAFVATAGWLRDQGLSAPEIVAHEAGDGLAVLEDLGDDLYARLIETGTDETPLYEAAVEVLARLHEATPPPVLEAQGAAWPFLTYDDLALRTGGDMFLEWWPKFSGLPPFPTDAQAEWEALWAPIRARAEAGASVFCHRDYHAENLIWLPGRKGVARVGLLDFQDAVRAHPAWDYLEIRSDIDADVFRADYHALGALNSARILFIFARQVAGFGKPRYEAFMPRTWRYLDRCLADPELAPIKAWFDAHVPPEARR